MALSIIKEMKIPTNDVIICLNTKFIYDIILGCILENPKGENVLNGGIPPCFNISGRNGLYKSTQIYSMLVSMLNIYPDSEAIVYETENYNLYIINHLFKYCFSTNRISDQWQNK